MWKVWHKLLIRFDKDSTVNFMNYGYAGINGDPVLKLSKDDEYNRFCIQLYDHVVNKVELKNKKVAEIGSGRGGGAHYISRYYKPEKYTGIDISPGVIEFCNRNYEVPGLSFKEGRAEKIPLEAETHDAVVNVESARCYSDLMKFFSEVHRILNTGGHFLFADVIEEKDLDRIRRQLLSSGFNILSQTDITKNVARGLELDTQRRESMISRKVPGFLRKPFEAFAATKGTKRYESFSNGTYQYWSYVLMKN
jgi:ubiquinone/menaquinone biosynthesis C-methylase UbiE